MRIYHTLDDRNLPSSHTRNNLQVSCDQLCDTDFKGRIVKPYPSVICCEFSGELEHSVNPTLIMILVEAHVSSVGRHVEQKRDLVTDIEPRVQVLFVTGNQLLNVHTRRSKIS